MQYTEHAPSQQLASIVHCVWTLEGDAAELDAAVQPILPDGRPELVVHFGDPFERVHGDGRAERQPAVTFAGQLTGPLLLRPTGRISVLGIRFRPDGASAVFEDSQGDLTGLTIGVDAVSSGLARALMDARDGSASLADAMSAVQICLADHCDSSRLDRRVSSVVHAIGRHRGQVAVDELAARAGLTRRHLERRFQRVVGVSPKRLARITRFQRAVRMLSRLETGQRGTHTAAMCGYADQAHFIRDFREFAGCPPGVHLLRQAELSGLFTGQTP